MNNIYFDFKMELYRTSKNFLLPKCVELKSTFQQMGLIVPPKNGETISPRLILFLFISRQEGESPRCKNFYFHLH